MHDEHKPLISRFPCYVESEGRSGEREGIRHARVLERVSFLRVELELRAKLRALLTVSISPLDSADEFPTSSIRRRKKK